MFSRLFEKINHIIVTLRFSILSIFITLLIATTLLIIFVTSVRFTSSMGYVSEDLMEYASDAVLNELERSLNPAATESKLAANLIEQGMITESKAEILPLTIELVESVPMFVSAYWGDEFGNFIYSTKEPDGSITTEILHRKNNSMSGSAIYRDKNGKVIRTTLTNKNKYDPRLRPWYIKAKKEKKTIWTDIYYFKPVPGLGIT